jgi:hypothetical protein
LLDQQFCRVRSKSIGCGKEVHIALIDDFSSQLAAKEVITLVAWMTLETPAVSGGFMRAPVVPRPVGLTGARCTRT